MVRVPLCPDCKEPGKPIRKNFFRCLNCGAVWQEVDWELKLAREQALLEEFGKRRGINSLIVIGSLACDNCGKIMQHGEKYCQNWKELIQDAYGSESYLRGKRYCEQCSVNIGYLHAVNVGGREEFVLFERAGREGVKRVALETVCEVCDICRQPLVKIRWDYVNDEPRLFILACNNTSCKRFRNPQGSLRLEWNGAKWQSVKAE